MNFRVCRLLSSRGMQRSILDPDRYGRSWLEPRSILDPYADCCSGSEHVKQREVSVIRSIRNSHVSHRDAQRQLRSLLWTTGFLDFVRLAACNARYWTLTRVAAQGLSPSNSAKCRCHDLPMKRHSQMHRGSSGVGYEPPGFSTSYVSGH